MDRREGWRPGCSSQEDGWWAEVEGFGEWIEGYGVERGRGVWDYKRRMDRGERFFLGPVYFKFFLFLVLTL
jgi:hypothetical protein